MNMKYEYDRKSASMQVLTGVEFNALGSFDSGTDASEAPAPVPQLFATGVVQQVVAMVDGHTLFVRIRPENIGRTFAESLNRVLATLSCTLDPETTMRKGSTVRMFN